MIPEALRDHLIELLHGGSAHRPAEDILRGFPEAERSTRPPNMPHSAWELVEHLRLTQADLLDFCTNPNYAEPEWPADYWPSSAEPASSSAWDDSVEAFLQDLKQVQSLVADPDLDLYAEVPAGDGQIYLREVLLVADHNAYHLGQMVILRRLLNVWPPS